MVLKYADSIAKGFSLACAVLLTTAINIVFFHATFTFGCLLGIFIVLSSMYIYIVASTKPKTSDLPQVSLVSKQINREKDDEKGGLYTIAESHKTDVKA